MGGGGGGGVGGRLTVIRVDPAGAAGLSLSVILSVLSMNAAGSSLSRKAD